MDDAKTVQMSPFETMRMSHIEVVQRMYDAFGQGNVPEILNYVSEDVEWNYGDNTTNVPWLQPVRGRGNVPSSFASLEALEFHSFRPTRFFADADVVVVLLDVDATVKATGRRLTEVDQVHLFWFNALGQVSRFRHRVDTHLQALSLKS